MNWVRNFVAMPYLLKLMCLLSAFTPAIAVFSTLSGSVLQPGAPTFEYGAARNLSELIVLALATTPIFAAGVFIVMRRAAARYLFPIGLLCAYFSPLLLVAVRDSLDHPWSYLASGFVVSTAAFVYLIVASSAKRYFVVVTPEPAVR